MRSIRRSSTRSEHRPALAGALLVALGLGPVAAETRQFAAEGADTGAGLGARYVAMGGAGLSLSDDVHAAYYNPAGLADVDGVWVSLSRQLDARLQPFSFIGVAARLPLPAHWGLRGGAALAFYPRIHARARGAFNDADFECLFLRYLLPGIAGTFDGEIDTKTRSTRLALGVSGDAAARWSLGAYLEHIDCRSAFCGVHATSPGFTTSSTEAVAVGVGLGGRWRATERVTLAASVNDLRTRLAIDTVTRDADGTRRQRSDAAFPRRLALGAAWHPGGGWRAAAEWESTRGRYGRSAVDLRILRFGLERSAEGFSSAAWAWRAGLVAPLRVSSTATGRLSLPFPVAPTAGLGWRQGPWQLDFALYAHAVMSIHRDKPVLAADLGLSWRH